MTTRSARRSSRPALPLVLVLVLAVLVSFSAWAWSSRQRGTSDGPVALATHGDAVDRGGDTRLGVADGAVPDGLTVFDESVPAVTNLRRDLLSALRTAATDAQRDGVTFVVDSGWRSVAYQEKLLREAIVMYGSRERAARWVATPQRSAHVRGAAVDIGPEAARAWLSVHGAAYGLCQVYRNEPWHFEVRRTSPSQGCPGMVADARGDRRHDDAGVGTKSAHPAVTGGDAAAGGGRRHREDRVPEDPRGAGTPDVGAATRDPG